MNLSPLPIQKFFDNAGNPLNGGLLFTYVAGTTTKIATYQDQAGTPNTNPIVLNFRGEANVWLDKTLSYKFVLAPANDTDPPTSPIWSIDNIAAGVTWSDLSQAIIGQILFPRTTAESSALVTPTNYAIPSHDAVGHVLPHRYGWSTTANGSTNYTALVNAHLVAVQAKSSIHLGAGSYAYKPTAELVSLVDISGEGMNFTSIVVDTGSYTGRMFRCTSAVKFHDFDVDLRPGVVGTGIFISDVTASSITGYMVLEHVAVYGGAKGIEIGNCFEVSLISCRVEAATEGIWCVPDSSGGFGLVYLVGFIGCEFNNNARNVHFLTPVNSYNVSFTNCAIENPSGAVANADFQNIFHLSLINTYGEHSNTIPAFRFSSIGTLSIEKMFLLDTGQIRIDDNTTTASLKTIATTGSNSVLNSVGTTNLVTLEGCSFPSSGNTLGGTFSIVNTTINGTYYKFYGPTTGSMTLTLTGCTTSPTASVTYSVSGDDVSCVLPVISATSNSTSCTLTGIPAAIRPATSQFLPVSIYQDNGAGVTGVMQVTTAGVIALSVGTNSAGFTAAGTKGTIVPIRVGWKLTA